MTRKFTIVRPAHTRGIKPRCGKKEKFGTRTCTKARGHAHNCTFLPIREGASTKKLKHVSPAARLDCLAMIEDPIYRARLLKDLRTREVRPAVECMLWYYAKGKPKEMVEHSGTLSLQQELSALTEAELKQRALAVAKMLTA